NVGAFLLSQSSDSRAYMGGKDIGGALGITVKAGMSMELHDRDRSHPTSFWGKVSTKVATEVKSRYLQKHNGGGYPSCIGTQ
ncbi:hypothetical protein SARC_15200, partial [Sphaeroforma arctica JP610]